MVYVNSKKFACESCIKGHRSSSCHHTDRPLFEIKKKGRPVSQCTKCRELRQSKKFHSKCTCNHQMEEAPAVQPLASSSNSKTRRFIPIVPALPNGLRDVLGASKSSIPVPADSRQRVDSLLNPCDCKSLWKCRCRDSERAGPSAPAPPDADADATDGLVALANAAAAVSCCAPLSAPSPTELVSGPSGNHKSRRPHSRPASPGYPPTKRQKQEQAKHHHTHHHPHHHHHHTDALAPHSPGPDLAPLLYLSSSSSAPRTMPDFPSMPPMSEITSLAGSGCTCGIKCACPGCVEHRGTEHANHDRRDCADGCGTCVDPSIGMSLPDLTNGQQTGTSFLDIFFARAAALPPPPHRRMSFDPMDTTVYSPVTGPPGSQSFRFGTVNINLPKLECCGGQCKCPADLCGCRNGCAGCCADTTDASQPIETPTPQAQPPKTSCCS